MIGTYALNRVLHDAIIDRNRERSHVLERASREASKELTPSSRPPQPNSDQVGEKSDSLYPVPGRHHTVRDLAGIPGISVPAAEAVRLAHGTQVLGPALDESTVHSSMFAVFHRVKV